MTFHFALGTRVRDKVTRFQGVATSRTEFLNGCKRYGVQPTTLKDGLPQGAQFFDEEQLELVAADAVEVKQSETGGPRQDVRRAPDVRR